THRSRRSDPTHPRSWRRRRRGQRGTEPHEIASSRRDCSRVSAPAHGAGGSGNRSGSPRRRPSVPLGSRTKVTPALGPASRRTPATHQFSPFNARSALPSTGPGRHGPFSPRSEEHTSELQSRENLVCRLLLEKKKK